MPLANTIMSGFTPQSRLPISEPMRPKPVTTSSAISSTRWRSQTSRTSGQKLAAGSLDRFGNEGGDGVGALELDFALQQLRTQSPQSLRVRGEGVAVDMGRFNLDEACQQRLERRAVGRDAIGRQGAQGDPMVGPLERDDLVPHGLADLTPVLARQ